MLPLHLRAPSQGGVVLDEEVLEQQGCPDLPHAVQTVLLAQVVPLPEQTRFEQQGCPRAPQPPHDPPAAQDPATEPHV